MSRSSNTHLKFTSLVITLFFVSCSNNPKTDGSKENKTSPDSATTQVKVPQLKTIQDFVDTLYVHKDTFKLLPVKRLVLKYYVDSSYALTLHGWRRNPTPQGEDVYDPNEFKLNSGAHSPFSFKIGNFLGGVILKKREGGVKAIQDSIVKHPTMRYVVFAPEPDSVGLVPTGHFKYNILLTDYEPSADSSNSILKTAPIKIGIIANPSPPRNS